MNHASSRSHCIFTVQIEIKDKLNNSMRSSKLHLVDLAGSERIHKTEPDSMVKNEAKYINKSLSFLEQVIVALHKRSKGKKDTHVPYRNSMMTQILKDSLGGNCKTVMIATLALDKSSEDETLSTARFAHRCQKLVNDISINERLDLPTVVKKLQEQNIELSKRLFHQENIIRQQDSLIKSRVGNSASCSQESFISHTPSQMNR